MGVAATVTFSNKERLPFLEDNSCHRSGNREGEFTEGPNQTDETEEISGQYETVTRQSQAKSSKATREDPVKLRDRNLLKQPERYTQAHALVSAVEPMSYAEAKGSGCQQMGADHQ